jgi:hypothetical protein
VRITSELPEQAQVLELLLEGFVLVNMLLIDSGVVPPFPHDVPKLRYQLEPVGEEDWKLAHNVLRDGWGDCEDLAMWVAAGLRWTGEDARARVRIVRIGPGKLHAVVERGSGEMEDPSLDLLRRQHGGG